MSVLSATLPIFTPMYPRTTFAGFLELLIDRLGLVRRNGEADAVERARLGRDGRVDADDFAVQVGQRPAAVARVDRGIDLNEVLVGESTLSCR